MHPLQTLAVIGAGRLGRRLAALSAAAGYVTFLEDVLPSNLLKAEQFLQPLTAGAPGLVHFAATIEDAVRTADLIIDCVPDELESKLEIFTLLDRMAPPRAILGTPTRALSIADLASCTYRPGRCVAFQLPDVFLGEGELPEPCEVSMVLTPHTEEDVTAMVTEFWRRLGLAVSVRVDSLALP